MAEFLDLAAFADGDRKEAVGPAMVAYCPSAYEYISSAFRNLVGKHEKRNGQHDANWPDWYAAYMAAEQAGTELPR